MPNILFTDGQIGVTAFEVRPGSTVLYADSGTLLSRRTLGFIRTEGYITVNVPRDDDPLKLTVTALNPRLYECEYVVTTSLEVDSEEVNVCAGQPADPKFAWGAQARAGQELNIGFFYDASKRPTPFKYTYDTHGTPRLQNGHRVITAYERELGPSKKQPVLLAKIVLANGPTNGRYIAD